MKTPGSIQAFHALAAFLVVGLVECVSVKDESLLLSNQLDDVNGPEVNKKNDMRIFFDVRPADPSKTSMSPAERILKAIGKNFKGTIGQILGDAGRQFKAIYPGTAWCGDGNIANNPQELGLFKRSDSCCRAHDQCTEHISAGESKYGLQNVGLFTRSHCDCDSQFFKCLRDVKSLVSYEIGYTYFNVLRPQCYKNDYPAECAEYAWPKILKKRCLHYSFDTSKPKTWQWFDSPEFSFKR